MRLVEGYMKDAMCTVLVSWYSVCRPLLQIFFHLNAIPVTRYFGTYVLHVCNTHRHSNTVFILVAS